MFYVALGVSLRSVAVCIIDDDGKNPLSGLITKVCFRCQSPGPLSTHS
jgi:hypothetical protein